MPKPEEGEAGLLPTYENQKLKCLYAQVGAAYGSVPNLVKASKLPLSKVKQFLHLRRAYTLFTLATRNFKRRRSFATFKIEVCCLDLADVNELAKSSKSLKHSLVRQELFDRTKCAKGTKTKNSKEPVRVFLNMTTKKNQPKKSWFEKKMKLLEKFKKAAQKECKIFLQRVRPWLFLLNVQYGSWERLLTVAWKIGAKSAFTIYLISSPPRNPKKFVRLDTKECHEIWFFVHSAQQATTIN